MIQLTTEPLTKDKIEKTIVEKYLNMYGNNFAGLLFFGSYNNPRFKLGKSDIDSIALFKDDWKSIEEMEEEKGKMIKALAMFNYDILHFVGINQYKKGIYDKGSWSSWITLIKGCKIIYSTKEFDSFRDYLIKNPLPKDKLISYLKTKDKEELGDINEVIKSENVTKWLFSHLRRKVQILNYYSGNEPEFDYWRCLDNIKDIDVDKLEKLGKMYENSGNINEKEIAGYVALAASLTKKIEEKLR